MRSCKFELGEDEINSLFVTDATLTEYFDKVCRIDINNITDLTSQLTKTVKFNRSLENSASLPLFPSSSSQSGLNFGSCWDSSLFGISFTCSGSVSGPFNRTTICISTVDSSILLLFFVIKSPAGLKLDSIYADDIGHARHARTTYDKCLKRLAFFAQNQLISSVIVLEVVRRKKDCNLKVY